MCPHARNGCPKCIDEAKTQVVCRPKYGIPPSLENEDDTCAHRAHDARGERLKEARGDRGHEAKLRVGVRLPHGGRRDDERRCRVEVLADMGGFEVAPPEMRESTAQGSALFAGAAIGLFRWDLTRSETLAHANMARSMHFLPQMGDEERSEAWRGWLRAVDRSRGWIETVES